MHTRLVHARFFLKSPGSLSSSFSLIHSSRKSLATFFPHNVAFRIYLTLGLLTSGSLFLIAIFLMQNSSSTDELFVNIVGKWDVLEGERYLVVYTGANGRIFCS